MLAPELCIASDIDQLGRYHQLVACLAYSAGQHRLNTELAPCKLRVGVLALVSKDAAARGDSNLRQLGKRVDYGLSDAVAQVVHFGIAGGIGKRQNRE